MDRVAVVIVWAVILVLLVACLGLIFLRGAWLSRHDARRDGAEHGADDPFLHVDFHDEEDPHE